MPGVIELIERLSIFTTTPAVVAVMLTAGTMVVIKDWRASLFALVIQYVVVGLLLTSAIRMELAVTKTLVGAILCLILYMTARRVNWGQPSTLPPAETPEADQEETASPPPRWTLPTELPFRFLSALLVMAAVYSVASSFSLPDVSEAISLAVYTMAALGLLAMGLTDEPLKAGLGLLTFVSAFELFYTVLEPSLIVVGFLGLANFLIALSIAYLTVARTPLLAADVILNKEQ